MYVLMGSEMVRYFTLSYMFSATEEVLRSPTTPLRNTSRLFT